MPRQAGGLWYPSAQILGNLAIVGLPLWAWLRGGQGRTPLLTLRLVTQMSQKLSLNTDSMCRLMSGRLLKRGAAAAALPASRAASPVNTGCV